MSVVIKSNEFNYKDPTTGNYVGLNAVAETTTAQQVQKIEDKGQDVLDTIPSDYTDLQNMIVSAFDTTKLGTYQIGDYVRYNDDLYRCSADVHLDTTWVAGHWTQTQVCPEISDLKSAIAYKANAIPYTDNLACMIQRKTTNFNGVNVTVDGNTINLNGTANANTPIQLTEESELLSTGDYYTFTFWDEEGSKSGSAIIYIMYGNGTYATASNSIGTNNIQDVKSDRGTSYIRLYFTNGATFNNYSVKFMLHRGNVYPTSFSEYGEYPKKSPFITVDDITKDNGIAPLTGFSAFTRFMSVGDSLSVGYYTRSDSVEIQVDKPHSWGATIERVYGPKCYWSGKAGETTKTWLEQTAEDATWGLGYAQRMGEMPLYVVSMGANEGGITIGTIADAGSDSPTTLYGYVGKLIRELRSISPSCYIVMLGISRAQAIYATINKVYEDVAGIYSKCYYFDIQPMLQTDYFTDCQFNSHYSAIGYNRMGIYFNKVLTEIMTTNVSDFLYINEIDRQL